VHCPTSNLKLGSGIADIVALGQAGVSIAIGTDGPASNDDLNLWEDLRLAALLARGTAVDPTVMAGSQAFGLATHGGAHAIGMPEIGELRVGAWADVVRIDLEHPALAPVVPADLFGHLVWAGGPEHVTDVWVAGNRVVEDRTITSIDVAEVLHQATTRGRRIAEAAQDAG
jgi:5-methylthioadenosine/S-adenosylhomocysteine deaminase